MSTLSFSEKLFGTTVLDSDRALLVKKTYALLLISVVTAVAGGYTCATSQAMVQFFVRPVGWIVALALINIVPMFALWASRQNPNLGIVALAADGFISGIALGPLLAVASYLAPGAIPAALSASPRPTPECSRICTEPIAPAESTVSRVARTSLRWP